jgi:RimJ/RimL family protein N-acetyltransferase
VTGRPDDPLRAFRDLAAAQVPGFPAGAGSAFDVTRHGLLDHVQRVALRALVLDLRDDLDARAVEAAATLGELAALAGDAAAEHLRGERPLAGRRRGAHQTARVRLVPVEPRHVGALYVAATEPGAGHRWRWRGRTPSPEDFQHSLFAGVTAQYVAESVADGRLIGLVVAYDQDPSARHCHIGFLRCDAAAGTGGAMVEALALFLDHLFRTFPFEKLFAELPEYNLPLVAGLPDELVVHEGRLAGFYWYAGRLWDRCHISVHRRAWEPVAAVLFGGPGAGVAGQARAEPARMAV